MCKLAASRRTTNPVFLTGQERLRVPNSDLKQAAARGRAQGDCRRHSSTFRALQSVAPAYPKYYAKEFGLYPRSVGSHGNTE